jgi:hypothetical protein
VPAQVWEVGDDALRLRCLLNKLDHHSNVPGQSPL